MSKIIKHLLYIILALIILSFVFEAFSAKNEVKNVKMSEISQLINQGKVEYVEVSESEVTAKIKDTEVKYVSVLGKYTEITDFFKNTGVEPEKLKNLQIGYVNKSGWAVFLDSIVPFLVPFVLISLFIYFLMRNVQGANNRALTFGQSSARLTEENKIKVKFADVAGVKEAKEELKEVVDFLRFPQKFLQLGAKIPKGVLLLGSPGVGKTLLARAVAGEANVPFFHISGSEFVEMFVGVGAARVRDLFKKAKKNSPCIVFVDEIDAVGRQRGAGLGGGHDEREQTLNQILVEMDGFENDTNVIVMAATNRPDVLDPALLRPGRFDRQVVLDLPDIKDREAILNIHAKNKPLASDANLRKIAERTPGFSGADLANILNEAAILTARVDQKEITQLHLKEAVEKVMLGPERKSHILSPKEKEITAFHEGGHALVGSALTFSDPVHKVSIISRGRAAGYTMKLPFEDKHLHTRSSFLDEIAALMGGYAAEKLVFNELTTGASNDLKVATGMARKLIMAYGMSEELGPVALGNNQEMVFLGKDLHEQRNYSEEIARKIDLEINRIMTEGLNRATQVLTQYREYLDKIAKQLVEKETIEQEEFHELVKAIIPKEKLVLHALAEESKAV